MSFGPGYMRTLGRIKKIARMIAAHKSGDPENELEPEEIAKLVKELEELNCNIEKFFDSRREGCEL
jgi:hypothetical protein